MNDSAGNVELIPVAPDTDLALFWTMTDVRKVVSSPAATESIDRNRMSIVLVLSIRTSDGYFNVFLGSDADCTSLDRALTLWQEYARQRGIPESFQVVKIPHHGSVGSLSRRLCELKSPDAGSAVAVITAGRHPRLPNRAVIEAFIERGWRVVSTTTRKRRVSQEVPGVQGPRRRALSIVGRSQGTPPTADTWPEHLVEVSWSANGIDFRPAEAEITVDELDFYESSRDKPDAIK